MTATTPQITHQNLFNETGFVNVSKNYLLFAEKIVDQYNNQETDIKDFIKKEFPKKSVIKLDDIIIAGEYSNYIISIKKKEFKLDFDFSIIDKDVKNWTNLNALIKQIVKTRVTELIFIRQEKKLAEIQKRYKLLTDINKGATKKSMNMIKAERLTMFDFDKTDTLFDCIKEEGKFDEVKKNMEDKRFLHLRTNYQYVYDAILSYLKLYRYSLKDKEAAELNKRNGDKIVMMIQGKDADEISTKEYEKRLRIQDDWQAFCTRAGLTTADERNKLAKELQLLQDGSNIPAMTLLKVDGCDTLEFDPNFISYKLKKVDAQNSNLKNVTDDNGRYISEIILYVEPQYLTSILDVSGKGSGGWAYIAYPLGKILKRVFEVEELHKKLIRFCIKHKFKRSKGDQWSSGYRDVYDEIHADIYFKEATEYRWKGEPCLLIVLNEKKLKEYAQRVYKRSIKKNGKFARSEAREYILTALEVIRLAMDNKEKDLTRILHFQYIAPAIHIYVSKLPKEECKALEKSLVLG
tara:strand:- start:292 stop:1851 length:1560 start_codon:yes stop_codon:yes gene_type:complete